MEELLNENYQELNQAAEEEKNKLSEEINNLDEILLNTQEQGQMLEHLIKKQIEVKDKMIEKLHLELEGYRQDVAERYIIQVMKGLIKVRKDAKKIMYKDNWHDLSADDLRREYTYLYEDLTDLLEQQLVDEYTTDAGESFNPSLHQVKSEVTDKIELDKKVKQSISEGYMKSGKVILPERVIVYQYKENKENKENEEK